LDASKPLIIIGTGRCGSTMFHRLFAYHPNAVWLTRTAMLRPDRPRANRRAMQIMDKPFLVDSLGAFIGTRLWKLARPVEGYRFWEYHCRGFTDTCRDLVREDVTRRMKMSVRKFLSETLTSRRTHLVLKLTNWSRIGFMREIFPDAKFLHIYRDPRAVVNSWLNVDWWGGWRGPQNWLRGELTHAQRQSWERYGRSYVILAAIEWEILMSNYACAAQTLPPEDYMEISYEALCRDPITTLNQVQAFAGLPPSTQFDAKIKSLKLRSANDKWKKDLTEAQHEMLCEYLQSSLAHYGYQ
jgi:hypothetical protein